MDTPLWVWVVFNAVVLLILVVDLGIFHRRAQEVTLKEASLWTAFFVGFGLCCAALVWHFRGSGKGLEFLTGYVIEYSLSVDNIFVFVVLFNYFAVPKAYQHRVLFWGILVALILRGLMILLGTALVARFGWIIYVFGAFLLVTGARMLIATEREIHPERNPLIRICRRVFPMTANYGGHRFFVREEGRWLATPLFIVFMVVNITDVVFAVDSIPAIFGITTDPFIVYTSNICAVLGLRSLYFLLAGAMGMFCYLPTGLSLVLIFVGAKMLVADFYHIDTMHSLVVVLSILVASIAMSMVRRRRATTIN